VVAVVFGDAGLAERPAGEVGAECVAPAAARRAARASKKVIASSRRSHAGGTRSASARAISLRLTISNTVFPSGRSKDARQEPRARAYIYTYTANAKQREMHAGSNQELENAAAELCCCLFR
jgi:hypothetical protein